MDGSPVAGAEVTGCPAAFPGAALGEFSVKTDSAGTFRFTGVPEGGFPLAVSLADDGLYFFDSAAPIVDQVLTLPEEPVRLGAMLASDDVDLNSTSATITFHARSPVEGLNLSRRLAQRADETFDFGPVPLIPFSALFADSAPPGQFVLQGNARINGRAGVTLKLADSGSTTVLIRVGRGETVTGRVVDSLTSAPVAGVRVYPDKSLLKSKSGFATTDKDGVFSVPHVSELAQLRVEADEFYLLSPAYREIGNMDMAASLTLVMAPKPWVRGRVDDGMGNPVAGARLSVAFAYASEETAVELDSNGYFQTRLAPGEYQFMANAPGLPPAFTPLEMSREDLSDLQIRLTRGRQISGVVLSPEGAPVVGAQVLAQSAAVSKHFGWYEPVKRGTYRIFAEPDQVVITDDAGAFIFSGMPASTGVVLVAKSADYADTSIHYVAPTDANTEGIRLKFPVSGILHGTVVDEKGEVVAGAHCTVGRRVGNDYQTLSGISSTTGAFELKHISTSETQTLAVKKAGYLDFGTEVKYSDSPVSVTLKRSREKSVRLRLLDVETQEGVKAEVAVRDLFGSKTIPVTPDATEAGSYRIVGIMDGAIYHITASVDGYMEITETKRGEENPQDEWIIMMRPSGRITGRVVNEARSPVTDAVIKTDSERSFSLPVDSGGRFELELKQSYQRFYAETADGKRSLPFQPMAAARDVTDIGDIVVEGEIDLILRVITGATGKGVAGTRVEVRSSKSGVTDSSGEFRLQAERGASLNVKFPDLKISRYISVDCAPDESLQVVVIPTGSASLRGRLMKNGEPVAGAVYAQSNSGVNMENATASAEAGFVFENLAPGHWTFTANGSQDWGKERGALSITLAEDEQAERDISLDGSGVSGRVVDDNTRPVAGANVTYVAPRNVSGNVVTDKDGNFTLPLQDKGQISLRADKLPDSRSENVDMAFDPAFNSGPVTLVLRKSTGRVECTALSILDGLPLINVQATLRSRADGVSFAGVGEKNKSTIASVPPGTYELRVSAPGFSEVTRSITVEEGDSLSFIDVLSPAASVGIIVRDARGYAVAGVALTLTPVDAAGGATAHQAKTDPEGNAVIPGVISGDYQVSAISETGTATGMISTRNQQKITQTLVLQGAVEQGI